MKTITCWHFLPDNKVTRYSNEVVTNGSILTAQGDLKLCSNGLHGSISALDALKYAPGSIICRTEISGDIIEGGDKICGRNRKCLQMADATKVLRIFAADCAVRLLSKIKDPDPRTVAAIQGVRDFAEGKITKEELETLYIAAFARYYIFAAFPTFTTAAAVSIHHAAVSIHHAAYYAAYYTAYYSATAAAIEIEWQREELEKRLNALLNETQ